MSNVLLYCQSNAPNLKTKIHTTAQFLQMSTYPGGWKKTLKFYQGRVSPYWRRQTLLTLVKIFVSVLAAFLATMDLLTGVAILGSFGGAVVSWSEFSGITNKLRRYTSSIRKLIDVKTWWESLQTVEKASAENIQYLVDMCEEVLAVECQSWRSDGKASKVMEQALKDASKEPATVASR
jgi:hypothetical protein